ncbi:MAG: ParA family protein [Armatimonadota bacterium]
MTKVLAIVNQKGGVGKTTTAINLAAGLAHAGQRTLLVDLDPQGNATTGVGATKSTLDATVFEVLLGECTWEQAAVNTSMPNLDLLPATLDLAGAVVDLATMPEREIRLRKGLEGAGERYPYIIIDTPPSLGLLPVNCLAAADGVIIPMQCEFYALEGLAQLEHTVRLMKRGLNPSLEIFGILLTMVDLRAKLFRDVINTVRRQYGPRVFKTEIPRTVRFAEAPSYGETIMQFDPKGKGSRAFHALTKEVIERC